MKIRLFKFTVGLILMLTGCVLAQSNSYNPKQDFKRKELLEQLKNKDYEIKKGALNALNKQGEIALLDDIVAQKLIDLLQDPDWRIRSRVVIVLGKVKNGDMVVDPLIAVLSDESAPVVIGAIQTLGKNGDKKSIVEISKLLDSKHPQVRMAAEEILIKLGSEEQK